MTLLVSNGEVTTVTAGSAEPGRQAVADRREAHPRVEVLKPAFSAPTNVKNDGKLRNKAFFVTREKEAIAERAKVWCVVKSGLRKEGPTSTEKRWSSLFESESRERHVIFEFCSGTSRFTNYVT